jgi:hypothetical protein
MTKKNVQNDFTPCVILPLPSPPTLCHPATPFFVILRARRKNLKDEPNVQDSSLSFPLRMTQEKKALRMTRKKKE